MRLMMIVLRPFFEAPDLTDDAETVQKENELRAQVEKYKQS